MGDVQLHGIIPAGHRDWSSGHLTTHIMSLLDMGYVTSKSRVKQRFLRKYKEAINVRHCWGANGGGRKGILL